MPSAIVPSSQQPIASAGGLITQPWLRFFNALLGNPAAIASVPAGASPYTYMAAASGSLRINGGTVSAITLTRSGTSVSFGTTATVPVANGDTVTITYSSLPTVSFIPS